MKRLFGILILAISLVQVQGQSTYRLVEQGNRLLKNEQFGEAEVKYRKALDLDGDLNIAKFNIGNAKYLQEDYDGAIEKYADNTEKFTLKKDKAEAFYNLGNAYLSQEKYEESIEAYKNSLRLVPDDLDAKYNLAYAQLKLKKQKEQEQQEEQQEEEKEEDQEDQEDQQEESDEENNPQEDGNEEDSDEGEEEESDDGEEKDSDEGNDKDGDEKDADDGEEEKDNEGEEESEEEQNEQGEDEQGQDEKPANANDAQLTDEQAEQILKMLQSEEGKLQEKLDEDEKGDPVNVIFQKDW